MFLHILKYELISSIRVKEIVIWLILFPVALGTLFKVAFSGLYEKETIFDPIPVAVVCSEDDVQLRAVLDSIKDSDEPLMKVTYADEEKARKLLKDEDVEGIIFSGEVLSLSATYSDISTTMLSSFVKSYNSRKAVIEECAASDPASAAKVAAALSEEVSACRRAPAADGDFNYYHNYFFNLIAMVALFGSISGLHIGIGGMADLSALGMRKCCSPAPKAVSVAASLTGSYIVQTVCMLFSVAFVQFGLRIDLGDHIGKVVLASVVGGILGVSMGFFIGSLPRLGEELKVTMVSSLSLVMCFFSGLMVGNMKSTVEKVCPFFNRINPAALLTDSFYYLNVNYNAEKYTASVVSMLVISLIFAALGAALTRRKKYASL